MCPSCARTASCPSSATSTTSQRCGALRTAPFAVLHFAPPPSEGRDDPRTQKLVAALARARIIPQRFVYISTSGVYGDCAGARVDETRPRRAQTPRARRRVAAEDRLARVGARYGVALAILRAPGIYADTRLPLERIRQGTPVLAPDDDVFTNHIHADDLARAAVAAMFHGKPNRAYNVADDAEMKMGSWFDAVADAFHLPRPPRVSWEEAEQRIAPMLLSFMSESRRLVNARLKRELRVRLALSDAAAAARGGRAARAQEAARAAAVTRGADRRRSRNGSSASTPTSGWFASTSRSASCCCCGRR